MIKEKQYGKAVLYFLSSLLIYFIITKSGDLKYALAIIISALCIIGSKNKKYEVKKLIFLFTAIIHSLIGIIIGIFRVNITLYAWKQVFFYLMPIILALSIYHFMGQVELDLFIKCQFLAYSCIFFYRTSSSFSFANLFESQYAFALGLFVLYFYWKKQYFFVLISFIELILAHKRITIGAFIVCFVVLVFLNKLECITKERMIYVGLCLAIVGMTLYALFTYGGGIKTLLNTLEINTQGRIRTWLRISSLVPDSEFIFGSGLGHVQKMLEVLQINGYPLLHNDILGTFIELGFMGAIIWMISFVVTYIAITSGKSHVKELIAVFILYTWLNYMTDNISIYIIYLFPLAILTIGSIKMEEEERYV